MARNDFSPRRMVRYYREQFIPERTMGIELDLHQLTVDEALPRVDEFLHDTYRAGLHYVRIVHGKGSGTLKQEVSRYLSKHPLVKSFHTADRFHGGAGATEIELIDR